jgi:hypothetical protein
MSVYIEDVDGLIANGEDGAVLVLSFAGLAVVQFTDFFGESIAVCGNRATQRTGLQGIDGLLQSVQPFLGRSGRHLFERPVGLAANVRLGRRGQLDLVFHEPCGRFGSRRMSANPGANRR